MTKKVYVATNHAVIHGIGTPTLHPGDPVVRRIENHGKVLLRLNDHVTVVRWDNGFEEAVLNTDLERV